MVWDFGKKIVIWSLILAAFLPVGVVNAIGREGTVISEPLLKKYDAYQIYFYNKEQACVSGSTIPGRGSGKSFVGDEKWDGSCTNLSAERAAWIQKYLSVMQSTASSNGLPWELIAAQKFMESGVGREACDYNPLGLKANKAYVNSGRYCVVQLGKVTANFAKFSSYEEAFQYYVNTAAMSKVKGKYPNDPYSAIAYIQSGSPPYYAVCDSESYSQCVGHMGEPTPGYVQNVSSIICGIQKWARSNGISISSVTWENYSPGDSGGEDGGDDGNGNEDTEDEDTSGAIYCNNGKPTNPEGGDDDDIGPGSTDLVSYIKAWVWPDYQKGRTERKPAYAEYMDSQSTYHPCGGVDCGAFVSNIIRASGWDPNYQLGPTSSQSTWLANNWERVSPNSLRLGDVGIRTGHVILYIGNISGFSSNTASASDCNGVNRRAPSAGSSGENLNNYTWYRKRG